MATVTYYRYCVGDILINKEYAHLLDEYINVTDEEGNILTTLKINFVGVEKT